METFRVRPGQQRTAGLERWAQTRYQAATHALADLGHPFWPDHQGRLRDRAMFDLAIDSKMRGCDVVTMKIGDVVLDGRVRSRATVVQQKTGKPVKFELLDPARTNMLACLECRGGVVTDYVFPNRINHARPLARGSTPVSSTSG